MIEKNKEKRVLFTNTFSLGGGLYADFAVSESVFADRV